MTPTTSDLLLNLGRTTLTLSVAVLLIGILLRMARVTAPSVHRAGCVFARGCRLVAVAVAGARAVVRTGSRGTR